MTNSFLPEGYDIPVAQGDYVKLVDGTTKLRILSEPVIGRLDRKEEMVEGKPRKKPLRYHMEAKPTVVYSKDGLKHFRAMSVYNFDAQKIQVFEITQKSLMNSITALIADEDFKDIYSYPIKITKEGKGMDTKYSLLPGKAEDLDPVITQMYLDTNPRLELLFEGGHPIAKK